LIITAFSTDPTKMSPEQVQTVKDWIDEIVRILHERKEPHFDEDED